MTTNSLPSSKIERNYFYNKNIWITGASSGIGEQLAYDLSKLGARIILSSRRKDALEAVKNRCEGYSNKIIIMPLDLSDHGSILPKVQQILLEIGKIDILINNGGISQRAKAVECDLEVDKQIMAVNFFGSVAMTKAILPSMIRHQLGQIITITSVSGKVGVANRSGYCASKFACHGFFDALRAEVAESDIHVMTVCPGYVKTNIAKNALRKDSKTSSELDLDIENGMTTEYVSKCILNGIRKKREEVYIGKKEVLGIYIMRFFPKLFFRIAKKLNTSR
jgi:short-subunit dehydrogenase